MLTTDKWSRSCNLATCANFWICDFQGMVLVSPHAEPACCIEFEAEVYVLFHSHYICKGFQTVVHVGNVCQTAKILHMDKVGYHTLPLVCKCDCYVENTEASLCLWNPYAFLTYKETPEKQFTYIHVCLQLIYFSYVSFPGLPADQWKSQSRVQIQQPAWVHQARVQVNLPWRSNQRHGRSDQDIALRVSSSLN